MLVPPAALVLAGIGPARGQVIRDDFVGAPAKHWYLCNRAENRFGVENIRGGGFRALRTTVSPRPDLPSNVPFREEESTELLQSGSSCRNDHGGCLPNGPNDNHERAEIWEDCSVEQKLGTEVWYQFSMFVDGSVDPNAKRLVIGQWKQSPAVADASPVLAQRFSRRQFSIAIEQDNKRPGHDGRDTMCRVIIAADQSATLFSDVTDASGAEVQVALPDSDCVSFEHDFVGASHDPQVLSGGNPPPCASDLKCERLNDLPNPFGRWVTMRYHIVFSTTDGLIEVWADDKPIARVTGRIGYQASDPRAKQYFKFGPYRDHEPKTSFALIAKYRRGYTEADVK